MCKSCDDVINSKINLKLIDIEREVYIKHVKK